MGTYLCEIWIEIQYICSSQLRECHYNDVIMTAMASHITSLIIVYSTVYSSADKKTKHQSSASQAFVRGIPRTTGESSGNCFYLVKSSWPLKISSATRRPFWSGLNVRTNLTNSTKHLSHLTQSTICDRNLHMCAHFCYEMVHCGIFI